MANRADPDLWLASKGTSPSGRICRTERRVARCLRADGLWNGLPALGTHAPVSRRMASSISPRKRSQLSIEMRRRTSKKRSLSSKQASRITSEGREQLSGCVSGTAWARDAAIAVGLNISGGGKHIVTFGRVGESSGDSLMRDEAKSRHVSSLFFSSCHAVAAAVRSLLFKRKSRSRSAAQEVLESLTFYKTRSRFAHMPVRGANMCVTSSRAAPTCQAAPSWPHKRFAACNDSPPNRALHRRAMLANGWAPRRAGHCPAREVWTPPSS